MQPMKAFHQVLLRRLEVAVVVVVGEAAGAGGGTPLSSTAIQPASLCCLCLMARSSKDTQATKYFTQGI